MENLEPAKKAKASGSVVKTAPVRVAKDTRKRIVAELAQLNKKDLGRNVKADDLIALALTLLGTKHKAQLQDATLSNTDRLHRRYLSYVKDHGAISKDDFLGKFLSGTVVLEASAAANADRNEG